VLPHFIVVAEQNEIDKPPVAMVAGVAVQIVGHTSA